MQNLNRVVFSSFFLSYRELHLGLFIVCVCAHAHVDIYTQFHCGIIKIATHLSQKQGNEKLSCLTKHIRYSFTRRHTPYCSHTIPSAPRLLSPNKPDYYIKHTELRGLDSLGGLKLTGKPPRELSSWSQLLDGSRARN